MALTAEDKADIRMIVGEVVEEKMEQRLEPLLDMMDRHDRRQDAMMELLAPVLYDRHRYSDLRYKVDRLEEMIAEVQQRQPA